MVMNELRRVRAEQLPELTRTIKVGPHIVFIRCSAISAGRRRRYELQLSCGRRTAVVDVGVGGLEAVEASLERSVWAFVESLRVQGLITH